MMLQQHIIIILFNSVIHLEPLCPGRSCFLVQTNSQEQELFWNPWIQGACEYLEIAHTRLSMHFLGVWSFHQILKETQIPTGGEN